MIELKIVVCLLARTFEISAVYKELDAEADGRGYVTKGRKMRDVNEERAYQVGKGEPSDNLPCRVRRLKENGDVEVS